MGSGSSRSGRIPRRRRSPDRRQTGPGETASEGGTADQAPTAAGQEESGRDPRPATPSGGREETLRLLDQLLAESEAWGPQELTPRGPARLAPAVSPEKKVKGNPEDSCASELSFAIRTSLQLQNRHQENELKTPSSFTCGAARLVAQYLVPALRTQR